MIRMLYRSLSEDNCDTHLYRPASSASIFLLFFVVL
jgi:hypothetical protein